VQTARDRTVWKVRVLLRDVYLNWQPKTFFYSRKFNVDRWKQRAAGNENIQITFIGKYNLEEDSGE
jgi:hypothetical protein